ncbi:plastocyanin/azurin family copper-binding protein [Oxynema sp. CENA135]|uniref:plastocyanin/azurin family copper-binding protein n=1 Tax=Oxynema sp. CENA135 TaxID=984206 RepID=UPI00351C8DA0
MTFVQLLNSFFDRRVSAFLTQIRPFGAIAAIAACVGLMLGTVPVQASELSGGDRLIARQPSTEVRVSLGNSSDALKFFPDQFQFVAGKRYKLVLNNPSPQKHYFTAKDFADSIWTQKVEAGKVEVKGAIHELELKPGAEAEWIFVPMKPGTYRLRCTIPGHAEAGMVGTITISSDSQQT